MDLYALDVIMRDLTPHQIKILEVLYNANGGWLSRAETARELGKKRMTPYDIKCLSLLSDKQLIVTSTRPSTAPGSDFAYIYMMDDDIAQLLYEWARLRDKLGRVQSKQREPLNLLSGD